MPLADGGCAEFELDILPDGLTRFLDAVAYRVGSAIPEETFMKSVLNQDPERRAATHRRSEFAGEFRLPPSVVAIVRSAEALNIAEAPEADAACERASAAIRPHFIEQLAPTLSHYRFAPAA